MFERIVADERGMAMGMAVITIVIIGVMGAGLLTFVTTDLNTVVQVNQGQKAFDMADAGVEAAKRQLVSEPAVSKYDGGAGDVKWSASEGGMNLAFPDHPEDSVNVKINYDSTKSRFVVVAQGTARNAKRKVEAQFDVTMVSGTSGLPAYYTPGSIQFKKDTVIKVSMFAGGDIRFGKDDLLSLYTPSLLVADDPLGGLEQAPV